MADRRSQKALADFLSEAQETIDELGRELLGLEATRGGAEPNPQVLNTVFRAAHSLKGLAAMFGVERMAGLAHALEDLLDEVRMGRRALDAATLDVLLEAPELMGRMIAEEAAGAPASSAEAAERLAARLRGVTAAPAPARADLSELALGPEVLGVLTEYEEHRLQANLAKGASLFRIHVGFPLATFDSGLADLSARLKPLGETISTLPSQESSGPDHISFEVLFGSKEGLDRIRAAAGAAAAVAAIPRHAGGVPVEREPSALPARPAPALLPSGATESIRSVSQAVRVDIHKLDRLMNTVGELLLVKSSLLAIGERLRAGEERVSLGLELQRESRVLERKLDELQSGILEVRMVPLSQVFDKLARMVRKISREVGKAVELEVAGGEVELDKLIVEDLSDPLMHLIRNAIDHAIEPPEKRQMEGKPAAGRISLSATQRGNHVVIGVEDDGAGIDEQRIREVAVERGLATAEGVREMSRREVMNLIFVPGFSTARQVTSLSGRGVGMDVVKANIARLSGIIDITSGAGRGTRFELTLPVTLAIVRALLVSVSGRTYAVPLSSVIELLAVSATELRTIGTREVLSLRGTTLPLVRLATLFRLPAGGPNPALAWPPAKLHVVVVGLAQERLAVAVDDLVGQQDIVVKPLGPALQGVRGVAGATDLGNRRTVLVLDVGAIIEEVVREAPREAAG
jgi:two-component system chemotaxis sensor kinase CheA